MLEIDPADLFTAAGYPKLADLGVARMFGAGFDAIGTPAYVDPVVAAGGTERRSIPASRAQPVVRVPTSRSRRAARAHPTAGSAPRDVRRQ